MRATSLIAILCLLPVLAHAQDASLPDAEEPAAPPGASEAPGAIGAFVRPQLLEDSQPIYPRAAFDDQLEADVVLLLTVDESGRVTEVALAEAPVGNGFDEAALAAARKLRFSPATLDGVPTIVNIRYTFRFRLPEKETVSREPLPPCSDASCPPPDERRKSRLVATVYERGKGTPLANVEVYVLDRDEVLLTDDKGRFELELVPGAYAITIRPPGFYPFETTERLEEGEALTTKYFVRRHRRDRYKTIVWADEGRTEVARTSLADDELRVIPGTFGDPIRVAMVLPGVSAAVSGLSYPIIRGALPGDSLYEIDGIPVPMLYHLLFGTAVIHPRFTDEITFQPGGFSAESGRFPGGRISARTARAVEGSTTVGDISILSVSLFHARKLGEDTDIVAAARYGTLGLIIEGLAANIVFRYWDYQLRLGHRFEDGGRVTLTLLGVGDVAGELDDFGNEQVLHVGFRRADLRYRKALGTGWFVAGAQVGDEWFEPPDDEEMSELNPLDAHEPMIRPYLEIGAALGKHAEIRGGGDLLWQDFDVQLGGDAGRLGLEPDTGLTLGGWVAADLRFGPLSVTPSFRVDHYRYDAAFTPRRTSYDPRLSAAVALTRDIILKASAGVYHGPPRFSVVEPPIVFGPVPALNGLGLSHGLNRSNQFQAGIETRWGGDIEINATGFYHDNFYAVDFSLLEAEPIPADDPCFGSPSPAPTVSADGRSYGGELLVRRRLGKQFFGWLSYTGARSERTVQGVGEFPFDFDQTHVLNLVGSWDVGRNWTLGGVLHASTGRPRTPEEIVRCSSGLPDDPSTYPQLVAGEYNSARFPNYWRLDFRMQKREVYETWYFDFYIDFFNVLFQWETVDYEYDYDTGTFQEVKLPLFVPTIGVRGEW